MIPGMMADRHIVFTGERLDRAADRRTDPAWVAAQAASPAARAVLVGDDGVRVTVPAGEPRLALLPLAALHAAEPLLLGLDATGPVFAVDEGDSPRRAPSTRPPRGGIAAHGEGRSIPPPGLVRSACAPPPPLSPRPTAGSPRTPPRS